VETALPQDSLVLLKDEAAKKFSASGHGVLLRIDIRVLSA